MNIHNNKKTINNINKQKKRNYKYKIHGKQQQQGQNPQQK